SVNGTSRSYERQAATRRRSRAGFSSLPSLRAPASRTATCSRGEAMRGRTAPFRRRRRAGVTAISANYAQTLAPKQDGTVAAPTAEAALRATASHADRHVRLGL